MDDRCLEYRRAVHRSMTNIEQMNKNKRIHTRNESALEVCAAGGASDAGVDVTFVPRNDTREE